MIKKAKTENNRIILIIGQLPPPLHGSAIMTKLLNETILKLGLETRVISRNFSRDTSDIGKLRTSKFNRFFKLIYEVLREVRNSRPRRAVILLATQGPALYSDTILFLLLKLFKIPVISYLHTYNLFQNPHLSPNTLCLKFVLNKSDQVVVLSRMAETELRSNHISSSIVIIPNSIYAKKRIKRNTKKSVPIITFLSNLIPEKGLSDFISLMSILNKSDTNYEFKIAGSTSDIKYGESIIQAIEEINLKPEKIMIGEVREENKIALLNSSKFLIFTSNLEEAQPLVILEALSVGLPVITYNRGAIPEIIIDGYNGFIVSPGDLGRIASIISWVCFDESKYSTLCENAINHFNEHFSREAYEKNWATLIL